MKLAIVAGEASGDLHAADVVRQLKKLDPDLETFGIGGDLLAGTGMRLLHHAREMAIVGLFNVVRHLGMFRRVMRELVEEIRRQRPDAVLLVDYPEFNLRLARTCKELGLPVIYYISPQVWAWRRGRVRQIARHVDRMIVLFPFEADFYRQHGVPVAYVGHPLIEQVAGIERSDRPQERLRLALLPGSRRMEVQSLLPPMLDAVRILQRDLPVDAFVVRAPTIDASRLETMIAESGVDVPVVSHEGGRAIADADLALSSSGTATLECAVLGTPVIVMYRLSRATYWLATRLVHLRHFSLVNIVAGKGVVPELIQHEVNGKRIAAEAKALLEPERYTAVKHELLAVREKLGDPGTAERAAAEIFRVMTGAAR